MHLRDTRKTTLNEKLLIKIFFAQVTSCLIFEMNTFCKREILCCTILMVEFAIVVYDISVELKLALSIVCPRLDFLDFFPCKEIPRLGSSGKMMSSDMSSWLLQKDLGFRVDPFLVFTIYDSF